MITFKVWQLALLGRLLVLLILPIQFNALERRTVFGIIWYM